MAALRSRLKGTASPIVAAQFVLIGRRQLKGLAEPVELFRVVPEGAATSARRWPREAASAGWPVRWLAVAAVLIAVVATGAVIVVLRRPISGLSNDAGPGGSTATSGASGSQLAG